MMKSYKEYKKEYVGTSDISQLIVRFHDHVETLHFGGDDTYWAYVVDEEAEIGDHYKVVAEGEAWVKIYDDQELTFDRRAKQIRIYQAGFYGVIVQLIGEEA